MVGPLTGWAVDANTGRLLRTSDAGDQWVDVTPPGLGPNSALSFLGADEAWANATATLVPSSPGACGYVFAPTPVMHTTDGGRTWHTLGQNPAVNGFADELDFLDPQHGWALSKGSCATQCNGQGAAVAMTSDGGAHWHIASETPGYNADVAIGKLPVGCGHGGLRFVAPLVGFMGEYCGAEELQLLATRDGGVTWSRVDLGAASAGSEAATQAPIFPSPSVGYVLAINYPNAFLFATHDSGHTWARVTLPESATSGSSSTSRITFVSTATGFFVDSRLYRTANGGATWTSVSSDLSASTISTIQFVTASAGFATSIDPDVRRITHLYRTLDGGLTWTEVRPHLISGP